MRMLNRAAPSSGTNNSSSSSSSSNSYVPTQDYAASSSTFHGSSATGVVIVGIVGKCEEDLAQLLDRMLDSRVFGGKSAGIAFSDAPAAASKASKQLAWIRSRLKHYYDEERGIVYVMFSWASLPLELAGDEDATSLPLLLEQHETAGMRGLLFIFSVCHIVLMVQEGARLDPKFLRVFRVLQAAKSAMASFVKSNVLPSVLPPSLSKLRVPPTSGSPARSGGRHISLMSGSSPTLFPGQCTPVLLFVFLDDFCDTTSDSTDTSTTTSSRRPGNKPEVGHRKRFQSSVEAQVRFLIRKCRTVLGFGEVGHGTGSGMGPRGPGGTSATGSALFTMDPSKVVLFVERSSNRPCEALEATTNIIESMLQGKPTTFWNNGNGVAEDILNIRDFIWRQSEIFRGRGGSAGASGGGVGMVAAAAAAAAASAAAGSTGAPSKAFCHPPELPTISSWLLACNLILGALLTAESDSAYKYSERPRSSRRNLSGPADGFKTGRSVEAALGFLDCGMGLDMNFSAAWCKRALPAARDVYLKGLPSSYPSAVHTRHLERSLTAFRNTVRGPAVGVFLKRLQDECESIWKSGRQLCDAVSLTGRPCVHQVHQVTAAEDSETAEKDTCKPHSSGVVFLSACACGRSRKLREDPFDYDSANSSFFQFPNCEELLHSMVLPRAQPGSPLEESAWSLLRLGNGAYYHPTVGLVQSGFCAERNFLARCDIPLMNKTAAARDSESKDSEDVSNRKGPREQSKPFVKNVPSRVPDAPKINEDSAFPPLPQKSTVVPKSAKLPRKEVLKAEDVKHSKWDIPDSGVLTSSGQPETMLRTRDGAQATIYVGFEHECARGHRFFLSVEHLQKLGPPYSQQAGVERKTHHQNQKRVKGKAGRYSVPDAATGGKSNRFQNGAVLLSDFMTDLHGVNVGEFAGEGRTLLNSDLPIFMDCPHCRSSENSGGNSAVTMSRLQRIFMVTPPFPLLLASCPVVQFDESAALGVHSQLVFSFECEVVLPPDSFLCLRLPFIYCTWNEDGSRTPYLPKEDRPEHTAWLVKGTGLYVLPHDETATAP